MSQRSDPRYTRQEPVRLPAGARPLCLFCGARPDEPGALAGFLGRLWGSGGLLGGAAGLMSFYANPRPLPFLAGLARQAFAEAGLACGLRAVLDASLVADAGAGAEFEESTAVNISTGPGREQVRQRLGRDDWDVVLLVYPDAIGLGAGALERLALDTGRPVYVLNGRRRLFALDPGTRAALVRRRFLARSRVVEKLLAVLAFPVGAFFLACSWLTQRRGA
jgi:hypothetical protein